MRAAGAFRCCTCFDRRLHRISSPDCETPVPLQLPPLHHCSSELTSIIASGGGNGGGGGGGGLTRKTSDEEPLRNFRG